MASVPLHSDHPADPAVSMGSMRVAVIDVGANTLRLLVANSSGPCVLPVHEERQGLGLGDEVERYGYITAKKLGRALEVARAQTRKARRLGCKRVEIIVTSPGRQSANGEELADALACATSVPTRILTAEEEACLAWDGAVAALEDAPERVAVCDVGGGSSQIAVGSPGRGVAWARSIDIGSLRLTQRHLGGDPPSERRLEVARKAATRELDRLEPPLALAALATGGTARALRKLVGAQLGSRELEQALEVVTGNTSKELSREYGIARWRARLLPAGSLILAEIQERLDMPLKVARAGLREGAVLELAERQIAAA